MDCNTENGPDTGSMDMNTFLEKCCEMVKGVDMSAASLMSSLDMMHTTTEQLIKLLDIEKENEVRTNSGGIKHLQECRQKSYELIMMLECTVFSEKFTTAELLRSFLHFIVRYAKENAETNTVTTNNFLLDTSFSKIEHKHTEEKIKRLIKTNEGVQKEINKLKEMNNVLNDKEKTHLEEKKLHKEKVECLEDEAKSLENNLTEITAEKEAAMKETNSCKETIEKQNEDIKTLQRELSSEKNNCMRGKEQNKELTGMLQNLEVEHTKAKRNFEKTNEAFQKEVSEKIERIKVLETELDESKFEMKQKENELQKIKSNAKETEEQYNKTKKEIENERNELIQKCNKMTDESNLNKKNIDTLTNANEDLNKVNQVNNVKINTLKKLLEEDKKLKDQLEQTNITHSEEIKKLQGQLSVGKKETRDLEDRIKEIQLTSDSYKKEQKRIMSEYRSESEEKLQMAQRNLESTRKSLTEKEKRIEKLTSTLSKAEGMNANLHKEIQQKEQNLLETQKKLASKCEELESKTKEMRRKINRLSEEKDNLSKVQVALEKELEFIKSKRKLKVQLYTQNRTSLTGIVEDGVKALLKEQLETDKLEVEFVLCAKSSDIQPDVPLLLLCITVSRLGTDVTNAIQGLTLTSKMAIVIFHHKDVHALPNQASERVLTGQELKNLGGVFDMAFLSGRGIYECEMNNCNTISLINFINREGVRKSVIDT